MAYNSITDIVKVKNLTGDGKGPYYVVQSVAYRPPGNEPGQAGGRHHVFIDVVDEDGIRLPGVTLHFVSQDDHVTRPLEEKQGELFGADFPMHNVLGSYSVRVGDIEENSDTVVGLGMGTPAEPDVKHHVCFELVFRRMYPSTTVQPQPEPDPQPDPQPDPDFDWVPIDRAFLRELAAKFHELADGFAQMAS